MNTGHSYSTTSGLVAQAALQNFFFPDYSTTVVLNNQSVLYYNFMVNRQTTWGSTVTDYISIPIDALASLYAGVC